MTNSDFKLLNNYLGSDAYAYIIIRSNKALNPLEERLSLYKKIKRKFLLGGVIYSNVNYMSSNCIALHNIADGSKSNSIIVRKDIIISVLGSEDELNRLIENKIIFIKDRNSINAQQARKITNKRNSVINQASAKNNAKRILERDTHGMGRNEWIKANSIVLQRKSTVCEKLIYMRLYKSLKKRVKSQVPFTINGNIYFADICIKCKKLIIEVDGGYHNIESRKNKDKQRDKDFSSIGYTTIRITNDEVNNPAYLSKFISDILATPNVRKS